MIKAIKKMYGYDDIKISYCDRKTHTLHLVKYSILPYMIIIPPLLFLCLV